MVSEPGQQAQPSYCGAGPAPAELAGYALASFVLIVIPGPSVLFVVGRALAYGRRTALTTVVGNAAGNYNVAVCIALGLGVILERSDAVFEIVKLSGALYLVWLGIRALRDRKRLASALDARAERAGRPALRDGYIVGLTNPKALILFGAVLPQFVDRAAGDVVLQMLVLALV